MTRAAPSTASHIEAAACGSARRRVFPEKRTVGCTTVPLSVLDSSVVRFATAAAVWYFDAPNSEESKGALLPECFSLERTLNWYPQWAGQLHWAAHNPLGDHTQRAGRLLLTYGTLDDPGVEFVAAKSPIAIDAFLSSAPDRLRGGFWDATCLPSSELLPSAPLPLHDLEEHIGLPGLMVQVTTFACGGTAISVKFAHPLADAQTLAHFVHDWATMHRAMVHSLSLPTPNPVFDPQRIDRAAAGDIDAPEVDPELLAKSRALPRHRYDWWITPEGSTPTVPVPLKAAADVPAADPMPWAEWDTQSPVSHYIIHFTSDEVQRMWKVAQAMGASPVSHHDALLAHVWTLVNRARGLAHDDEPVHMNLTLGLRTRVSPPLPDTSLGSPITLGRLSMPGCDASSDSPSEVAARIRSTVNLFDTEAVAALLHDMAHDLALPRLWNAFLGNRNLIVTSWVHLGLYDVDFGGGAQCARYVEAVMPSLDGCLQVMEARWYDDGVDISLHLATAALERLVKDPLLRKYDVSSDR
ncbi:hypothetical protein FOMPIDRAFT_124861 [Fomitopsis schrenkii]|uniref:Transferase family protein n=1 Tax=Fomitopsis schrenkii TaxID=2126942 RepID=S8FYU0_FOMSC|nr:hypothetical protein FOMPIDRAFT_124861 [Fomitopsis schrenkii]